MHPFEQLLACYRSGQMTETQWHDHLRNEVFCAWLKRYEPTFGRKA